MIHCDNMTKFNIRKLLIAEKTNQRLCCDNAFNSNNLKSCGVILRDNKIEGL